MLSQFYATSLCCHMFVETKVWTTACMIICYHNFVKNYVLFYVVTIWWRKTFVNKNEVLFTQSWLHLFFIWQHIMALDTIASLPLKGQHSAFKIECMCVQSSFCEHILWNNYVVTILENNYTLSYFCENEIVNKSMCDSMLSQICEKLCPDNVSNVETVSSVIFYQTPPP